MLSQIQFKAVVLEEIGRPSWVSGNAFTSIHYLTSTFIVRFLPSLDGAFPGLYFQPGLEVPLMRLINNAISAGATSQLC
jgi:hypothetical protein